MAKKPKYPAPKVEIGKEGEINLGTIVSNDDCEDYESKGGDKIPGLLWDDLLNTLVKYEVHEMMIMFVGKAGSDGSCGGTGYGKKTRRDVQQVLLQRWTPGEGKITDISRDENQTPSMVKELLLLNVEPIHVTGCVIKKLS
jgi:hypothetical protein